MGPIALARQRERVEHYIAVGKVEGARLVTGGGRPAHLDRGYFVEPTLFDRVDNRMTIAREEIFGPVIAVIPYEREADAVGIANDSEYGLSGSIFSYEDEAEWRIGRKFRTGICAKNEVIVARTLTYGGVHERGGWRGGGG